MKIHECYHEVRQEDDQRKSIVQQIFAEEHRFLEADHRASAERVPVRCASFPQLKTTIWWVFDKAREEAVQLVVRSVRRSAQLETHRTRSWLYRTARTPSEAPRPTVRVRTLFAPLKLLANQQFGGDRPVQLPV